MLDTQHRMTKRTKILISSAGGIVAIALGITLIVTLIVIPNRHAAEAVAASASAQALAEEQHEEAVDAFQAASNDCTTANTGLTSAISNAQLVVSTDPSTMKDPSLIDTLEKAITTAQSVSPCKPPSVATDTSAIEQQTEKLTKDTQTVISTTSTLQNATQAVPASVQAKKDADAAAAAAEVAAKTRGTANLTFNGGYTARIDFTDAAVHANIDPTRGLPGDVMITIDFSAAVTVTNTTAGKETPWPPNVRFAPFFDSDPCEMIGNPSLCSSFQQTIKDQTYWYISLFEKSPIPGVVGPMGMGKSYSNSLSNTFGSEFELSETDATIFKAMIENPALWGVYTQSFGDDTFFGGSENYDWTAQPIEGHGVF